MDCIKPGHRTRQGPGQDGGQCQQAAEIDRTKEEAAETHGWDDDLIASDLVYANVRGETSRVAYNPTHRWYYFSEMQTNEVLFIRVHDSANDGRARLSFHTSFEDPLTPGAPPREGAHADILPAGCLTPFS